MWILRRGGHDVLLQRAWAWVYRGAWIFRSQAQYVHPVQMARALNLGASTDYWLEDRERAGYWLHIFRSCMRRFMSFCHAFDFLSAWSIRWVIVVSADSVLLWRLLLSAMTSSTFASAVRSGLITPAVPWTTSFNVPVSNLVIIRLYQNLQLDSTGQGGWVPLKRSERNVYQ